MAGHRRTWHWRVSRCAAGVIAGLAAAPAHAAPEVRYAGDPNAVPGQYIVVLEPGAGARSVAQDHRAAPRHTYRTALRGFSARLGEAQARRLAADPRVAYVEQDRTIHLLDSQVSPPSWGLDRIDQRMLPLSETYAYATAGERVKTYILDTGIRRTHTEFSGRAIDGFDAIDGGPADDCNGHGTHVAGTAGGSGFGVAKRTTLVAVRVLGCGGGGTISQVIAGVDWVTQDHVSGPAVANMSLGGTPDTAFETAVENSIADGVVYVVAAGNDNVDACRFSPAAIPTAITVGATTSQDARSGFSNFGACLDLFAPGSSITSTWHSSDTASNTLSGTSMASPHVAGAAARVLSAHPRYTPRQVRDVLIAAATRDLVTSPGTGSPNLLLFVDPLMTDIAPAAADDAHEVDINSVLVVDAPGVLGNDADADADPLGATLVSGPSHGTLELESDGSFTYTPDPDYWGPDSFTYRAEDGVLESSPATVAIAVRPLYGFAGFGAPIDNDTVNAARAGQIVPVKYRVVDRAGAPVDDPSSFDRVTSTSNSELCAGQPAAAVETYAGDSGLRYLGDGNWQYNWKTPKGYAGQCRSMTLRLRDGSRYSAAFRFE